MVAGYYCSDYWGIVCFVQCDKTLGQKIAAHVGGKANM